MRAPSANPESKALIWIDASLYYTAAIENCLLARARIAELKRELHRFDTSDRPAFERWYHRAIGGFLTELRELGEQLQTRSGRLEEIRRRHWQTFFGVPEGRVSAEEAEGFGENAGRGGREGRSRARGDAFGDGDGSHDDEKVEASESDEFGSEEYRYEASGAYYDDEESFNYDEDEGAARDFEERLRRGSNGPAWSYRSRGGAGGANGQQTGGRESREGRRGPGAHGFGDDDSPASAATKPALGPSRELLRDLIKERYRTLVRRLHPDLNPTLTVEERELWHQVQAAYQKGDLDQLDVLIALSEAFTGRVSDSTNLDQLQRAAREVENLIAPLARRLQAAQRDRAWNFFVRSNDADTGDTYRADLRKIVTRELQREVLEKKRQLNEMAQLLARFERNRARPEASASASF